MQVRRLALAVAALALAAALVGCYAHNGPPTPSCAQDPSQAWCAPAPFSASEPDAGRDR